MGTDNQKLHRSVGAVMMQGIITTALERGLQIDDQRWPTAKVVDFATLEILNSEAKFIGVAGVGFAPKP